jgi:hypothetical protein
MQPMLACVGCVRTRRAIIGADALAAMSRRHTDHGQEAA